MDPKRPLNILFFLPDQWRTDWLGVNSELPLCTPNIDELADIGVLLSVWDEEFWSDWSH